MNNSARRALDIALATEARGMYAGLLSAEEKERIAQIRSVDEFLRQLQRSEAWHAASLSMQAGEPTDTRFSEAVSRCVLADYEKLYRFANDMSRQFLNFITMDVELQAVMKALRRLLLPDAKAPEEESEVLPPALRSLPGHNLEKLRRAKTYEDISAAVAGGIFEDVLASLELDGQTGLPSLTEAGAGMESRFFEALAEYMRTGYTGPARRELGEAVGFRADMLNISYIMRLRRFNTSPERSGRLLLPLHGSVTAQIERRALEAGSDEEAFAILRSTRSGKYLPEEPSGSPEQMIRAAQRTYFRRVLHGRLNLAVVYAFLTLKQYEGDMLRRVFVALRYGLSPAEYVE